ncbi:ComEC/Rec2 family competence protein [Patescibacteria group bacterium]
MLFLFSCQDFLLLVCLMFFLLGFVRMYFVHPNINEESIHFYQHEEIYREIEGVIVENPDRRREKANYILDAQRLFINERWIEVQGRILFSMDLYPEFQYGDKVKIKGKIVEPMEFDTFSYKNYLSLFKVYSVMYYPRVEMISRNNGNMFFAGLFKMKKNFEGQLNKLVPEPMASFEAGLLTGSRKGIPDDLMQNFNLTGLTHIIAISGYNISLIIVLVASLFKNVSRNKKIPIIIGIIVVFTLFVGASAAVVRASIMGVIAVIALWFGRQSQVMNALLMSAFVMVIWNPLTLIYDVGFQLSFLATMGLILTGNHLEKLFKFLPDSFGLREAFAMTFSAQIFALPVIILNFKRFSLISPVANVLVVPFIPFAMLFGFLGVVTSYVFFDLGFILIFPAWLVLKYIVKITQILANLPLASFEMPWFSIFHFLGYYLLCLVLAYLIYPNFRNTVRFV